MPAMTSSPAAPSATAAAPGATSSAANAAANTNAPTYIPQTPAEQQEMLAAMGLRQIEDLLADIPAEVRQQHPTQLPPALPEQELARLGRQLAAGNRNLDDLVSFLGAGAYDHYIPAIVPALAGRQEFLTAYTPYQPEISQGTLQVIFEYQTMICELTGLDVSNASMYDGATALAEAASVACAATGCRRLLAAASINPQARAVLETFAPFANQQIIEIPWRRDDGTIDIEALERELAAEPCAAVIIAQPGFFGTVENLRQLADLTHTHNALLIVSCNPITLGLLESPGAAGADLAVGEGQPLGNPMAFGGPTFGFLAARANLVRRLPGRIVGQSVDTEGRRAFVLTLQTREQHIRREKATSNICTNQALCALQATIYLARAGRQGLAQIGELCLQKAHYLYDQLLADPHRADQSTNPSAAAAGQPAASLFEPLFDGPFFHEFALRYKGKSLRGLNDCLLDRGFLGGLIVNDNIWLLAVTEQRSRAQIDAFAAAVREITRELEGGTN